MSTTLITVTEARSSVLDTIRPLARERLALDAALGRVLAEDVRAVGDVPPFPCSAMDGYAAMDGPECRRMRIVGESRAGTPAQRSLQDGEAIRISTGAAVPAGATSVVAQENVILHGDEIETVAAVGSGDNIRAPGEDMPADTKVLPAGGRPGGAEVGAAAGRRPGPPQGGRRPPVT